MHSAKLQTAQWLITSSPEEPEVQLNVQILMACEWAHKHVFSVDLWSQLLSEHASLW